MSQISVLCFAKLMGMLLGANCTRKRRNHQKQYILFLHHHEDMQSTVKSKMELRYPEEIFP